MAPPRRRIRRHVITAAVCLPLGVVTTVGVAWWFSLAGQPWRPRQAEGWPGRDRPDWPDPDVAFAVEGPGRRDSTALAKTGRANEIYCLLRQETGWPWFALAFEEGGHVSRPEREDLVSTGIAAPDWLVRRSGSAGLPVPMSVTRLPTEPLWPGFALDGALYAGAWWALLFGPVVAWRWGRIRKRRRIGHCVACGYDMAGLANAICPECGGPRP